MDTTTLLIIIIVVLVVAFIMSRNRGTYGGYPRNTNTGPERPTYDDPNYRSGGSIGGAEVDEPAPRERSVGDSGGRSYDDPNYRSGGSIGGSG